MYKKTQEEYVNELKIKNPNIILVGDYINTNTKTMHCCLVHDVKWEVKPASVLRGAGCIKCHSERIIKSKTKKTDEYEKELAKINPYIKVLEPYITAKTPINHFCTIHSFSWNTMPTNVLRGNGCPECGKNKIREKNSKKDEQYKKELIEKNIDIVSIEPYINAYTPIKHKCLKCGCVWSTTPSNILSRRSCIKCCKSHGEKAIEKWLSNNNISFISQYKFKDCLDIKPLPFDFYLPNLNMCIEYDGEQHFRSVDFFGGEEAFLYRQKHDNIKNEFCKSNNISLLRISYKDNIEDKLNDFLFI